MRTNNSLKNTFFALLSNLIVMIVGFVSQTVFIKLLGEEYLGINGLFNNIISVLAIVELGLGPAIIFSLYKPLAENDEDSILRIMNFYRKSYNIIAIIIFILGILLVPCLKFFVNTNLEFTNFGGIKFIFLLFIIDASVSYILSYKRSIIQADQKYRLINITHTIMYVLMNFIQLSLLYLFKNYILYLVIKILFRFLENLVITIIANKMYPYIKNKTEKTLTKEEKENIFTKIKGLIFHKIGNYVVLGTDNILISKFLGVAQVGLYSNYSLIIYSVTSMLNQIFSSITASVGNLLVTTDKEKTYEVYQKVMFLNFWIYAFATTSIYNIMEPFIIFWLGEKFLLSNFVLIILSINFYMLGMRSSIGIYKEAAGIYYEDRFVPIIESIVNIIASIIFAKHFGLAGIFLGTITSSLIVVFYSLPFFVYKEVFKKSIFEYYKLYFKYAITTTLLVTITKVTLKYLFLLTGAPFLRVVISIIACLIIPNLLIFIIFGKTKELTYFKEMIFGKFLKK